jgi:hypothetical protein
MCGKLEGCHADCKNNPAHRLLRERLSMCEARVKWRKIPVTLVDQRSKRAIAWLHQRSPSSFVTSCKYLVTNK